MNLKDNKALVLFFFVVISLLIHLFFSFFFLEFGFKTRVKSIVSALSPFSALLSEKEIQVIQQQKAEKRKALQNVFEAMRKDKQAKPKFALFDKSKDTRPAKLVAPRSNFGWVIFDDNHKQPETLEIPTTKSGEIGVANLAHATELKPEEAAPKVTHQEPKSAQESKPTQASNSMQKQEPKKESNVLQKVKVKESPKIDQAPKTEKPQLAQRENLNKKTERPSTIISDDVFNVVSGVEKPQQLSVAERIKKIEEMQQRVEQYKNFQVGSKPSEKSLGQGDSRGGSQKSERDELLSSVLKKGTAKHSTGVVCGAASMKPGKSRNVIALTKGYIEKLDGENGTDLIDRDGDPNKRPDFEEMKYISYEAKLNWSCQATWEQNCNFYNLQMFAGEYRVVIGFTIGEKGELVKSEILESSGNKLIDSAVVKNLEFTAPFPPLPKHFGTTAYSTGRVVRVSINKIGF